MEPHQNEAEISIVSNMDNIEAVLKTFWEKARFAVDLITRLRDEKHVLLARQKELEDELQEVYAEISKIEQDMKRLKSEHAYLQQSRSDDSFTIQEKEELKSRIRELIAKINSHI